LRISQRIPADCSLHWYSHEELLHWDLGLFPIQSSGDLLDGNNLIKSGM
jgi:hypothetical protein